LFDMPRQRFVNVNGAIRMICQLIRLYYVKQTSLPVDIMYNPLYTATFYPPTQSRRRPPPNLPPPTREGAGEIGPYGGVKGALKRALLAVKDRICWRKGKDQTRKGYVMGPGR